MTITDRPAPARVRPRRVELSVWTAVLLVAAAWGLAPGLFTRLDPLRGQATQRLLPPSAEHWFGTDELGRDLFSRVVHGASLSLQAAVVAVALSFTVGVLLGAAAGFFGGWADLVVSRLTDVLLAVPGLLLALAGITVLGFGVVNVAVAVGLAGVAGHARVMRAEVLRVRSAAFVDAARGSGVGPGAVLARHVLPNAVGPVVALAALEVGGVILTVSALSFLGFGASPPTPEWGALVAAGRNYARVAWWLITMPGLVIGAVVLATTRIARVLEPSARRAS